MSAYTVPTMYERHATVERVVDGDTLHLAADLGCEVTLRMTVRLYGVNAPERGTKAGDAATAFVERWVQVNGPVFSLRTVRDKREKFGRWLVDLIAADNSSLCRDLLAAGHAVVYLP